MNTKYIFITGGVVSSLGKGIASASIGFLLKDIGYEVSIQKFDPYLNVDPGTMNPFQHGEVFVTDDGAETDLDLGHYERFLDKSLSPLRGALFENSVVMEFVKFVNNYGLDKSLYFYRDTNGNEVDIVYNTDNMLIPFEIKSSYTFNKSFLKGVNNFFNEYNNKTDSGFIVYNGRYEQNIKNVRIVSSLNFYNCLDNLFNKEQS